MQPDEKQERLINAASAILGAAPNNKLNIVILNKTLFYLDLVSLCERGETVTGNTFVAFELGPVVERYKKRLVEGLEEKGIAKQLSEPGGGKPLRLITLPKEVDYLMPFGRTIARLANFFTTSASASRFSHKNPGWQIAISESKKTGEPTPINMLIAMQQLLRDDAWLTEAIEPSHKEKIFSEADKGTSETW